ncbi:L,D-transpeptidase family protein [Halopseudomonas pertucinogena]
MTLNPSWTIPPTILREDKLPQIRSNPAYFSDRNLMVLDTEGTQLDPASVDWDNPRGILLREPPGPNNPLGRMVFRFDNPFAVFLHDTPSQALFARAVRNVSSGCVRVEQADELADYLFHTLDNHQRDRIQQRMDSGKTHEIRVENGPQVLLTYWTAEGTADGRLRFTPDPYGLDAPLIRAYHQATGLQ